MELPPGWTTRADGRALVKSYAFADFAAAFAFLAQVAAEAERIDHHPDVTLAGGRVDFALTSHDLGGLSARDSELAEAIERIAAQHG